MDIKIKKIASIMIAALFFISCQDDFYTKGNDNDEKTVMLSFELDQMTSNPNNTGETNTRSSTNTDKILTNNDLKFYLFKKSEGSNAFVYKPDPGKVTVTKLEGKENEYTVTFKIPNTNYGTIEMLVLAHYDGGAPTNGMSIELFNTTHLIKELKGAYNINNPIPLCGKCTFETSSNFINTSVFLLRNMARIGLSIENRDNAPVKMKSLKTVRVYRTLNKTDLYFPDTNYNSGTKSVVKPTIPNNTMFNLHNGTSTNKIEVADKNPLIYEVPADSPLSYSNMIFVPEKLQDNTTTLEEAQAVVVGVELEGIDGIRYYRVDIAKYEGLIPSELLPILRNHSYNIKLGGASNNGEATPEEALKTKSTAWVSVVEWNKINLDYVLNGQYFFGIETSELKLDWKAGSSISIPIKYDMMEEDARKAFSFAWKKNNQPESPVNERFTVDFNFKEKNLVIKTNIDNNSIDDVNETLFVRYLNHEFEFTVTQQYRKAQYMISGNNIVVNGVYRRRIENVSGVNTATVRLYSTDPKNSINGLRYTLNAKLTDGYWVDATGLFDKVKKDKDGVEYMDVTIDIKGKTENPKNKVLTVMTDAENSSLAAITIPVAYIQKKVLGVFGSSSPNSLQMNNNFKKLIESSINFGTDASSVVKSEGILYFENNDENLASLIEFYHPDVIIIGDGYDLSKNNNNTALSTFLKTRQGEALLANGVVIAMNTTISMLEFMKSLGLFRSGKKVEYLAHKNYYNGNNLREHSFYDFSPKPGNEKVYYRFQIPTYSWDLISNGPFGDIGAKFWRGDAETGYTITYPVDTEILKYSGMVPFGCGKSEKDERYDYGTTFFRSADYAFAWIGYPSLVTAPTNWYFDGNKIADDSSDIAYSVTSGSYETIKMRLCSNGVMFANLFNWALYSAEYGNY